MTIEAIDNELKQYKTALLNATGTKCEVYTRIVGYYRNINNWNPGKKDEYGNRLLFNLP